MERRKFIRYSTIGAASATLLPAFAGSLTPLPFDKLVTMPIGFQSYVLREEIGKDITGTLKKMAGLGYTHVEMCSPSGYMGPFEPLAIHSGKALKEIIEDTGMECKSSHFTLKEMQTNLEERIDFANRMGLEHFVCSGGLDAPSLDEVKAKCAELNEIGERIKKAGMIAAFHNHDVEFKHKLDGRMVYDILLDELDPEVVKMQYQTQPIVMGIQGSTYFNQYPGRFISAHLQDYSKEDNSKEIALGQGIADWKDFFGAAEKGGLEVVYVEMESNPATLTDSITYLKNL
jgi:sugar phosphate isomerase/epimerase